MGGGHKPLPRLANGFRHISQFDILPYRRGGKIGLSGRLRIGSVFGIQAVELHNIRRRRTSSYLPIAHAPSDIGNGSNIEILVKCIRFKAVGFYGNAAMLTLYIKSF